MSKHAVIVVDLQNEYLPTGNLPLHRIEQTISTALAVVTKARKAGDLIINIRHESAEPDAPLFTKNTPAVQFIEAMAAQDDEPVIVKNFPNSFRETELKSILQAHAIDTLTVVGAMSHMCIDATVRAAADFGYPVTVVEDACTTLDLEFAGRKVPATDVHAAFMAGLAFAYANVVNSAEYLKG
jgi:nicotinamidase-related amidase